MPTTVTYADGGLCVVDPQVFRGERTRLVSTLLEQLTQRDDIAAVACDLTSGRCQIRWADAATPVSSAAARFVEALQAGCAAEAAEPAWRRLLWSRAKRQTSPGERTQLSSSSSAAASAATGTMLVRGPKRLLYLAAGAGSSVMTVVGVLVPGIPTVPFLLSSSYFLARSSPRAACRPALNPSLWNPRPRVGCPSGAQRRFQEKTDRLHAGDHRHHGCDRQSQSVRPGHDGDCGSCLYLQHRSAAGH